MNEKLRRRLSDFAWQNCLTKMRINDAIINTIVEIGDLLDCGVISNEEFVRLGREMWMHS